MKAPFSGIDGSALSRFPLQLFPFAFLVLFFIAPLQAADGLLRSSNLVGPFQNLGIPAHSAAMAFSDVAAPSGLSSLDINPASLASLDRVGLAFHHHSWLQEMNRETGTIALPLGAWGATAFTFDLLNAGTLEERDAEGELVGSLSPQRSGFSLSWGRKMTGRISFGGTIRLMDASLAPGSDRAFSADLGALFALSSRLRFGASYCNWGPYVDGRLQASLARVGVALTPDLLGGHRTLFTASFSTEPYGSSRLSVGAEDLYREVLAWRAGWQLDLDGSSPEGVFGPSAGLGLILGGLQLDYSFQPFGELGNSHRIGLSYLFGNATTSRPLRPATGAAGRPAIPEADGSVIPVVGSSTPRSSLPKGPEAPEGPTLRSSLEAAPSGAASAPKNGDLRIYFQLPAEKPAAGLPAGYAQNEIALKKRLSDDPSNAAAWMELGRLYVAAGKQKLAIQCLEQVVRLRPDQVRVKEWLERYRSTPGTPVR